MSIEAQIVVSKHDKKLILNVFFNSKTIKNITYWHHDELAVFDDKSYKCQEFIK